MGTSLRNALFLLVALAIYAYQPTKQRLLTLGLTRGPIEKVHGFSDELRVIEDTRHCEDLHYWETKSKSRGDGDGDGAGKAVLFTACEGRGSPRFKWFPPMTVFDEPELGSGDMTGSIYVLDPETFTSTRLQLEGFRGPFVTHGIDLVADPLDPNSVYIHAINHLPNPDYNPSSSSSSDGTGNKARSQIEIFHHTLHPKSHTARHVRSIRHPLIRTPNDIYSISPGEFYVTNDHQYREHGLRRTLEDMWTGRMGRITDTVHVLADLHVEGRGGDAEDGVDATVVLKGMHNNNGLGRGATITEKQGKGGEAEVSICDAAGGVLHLARTSSTSSTSSSISKDLELVESIQMDSTIDNPTYFHDPYPESGCHASGYVLAGLLKGADYGKYFRDEGHVDPSVVWHVSRSKSEDKSAPGAEKGDGWTRRIVFQDDGERLSSASTAVILPIDPATNGGRKEGWLWVTGPSSKAVVATKIDLAALC